MSLAEHAARELTHVRFGEPGKSALIRAVAAFERGDWRTPEEVDFAIATLTILLLGEKLPEPPEVASQEWEPVKLGSNVRPGSRIRVRPDAYSNKRLADLHNGMEGDLVLVDAGYCRVQYDDGRLFQCDASMLEVLKA